MLIKREVWALVYHLALTFLLHVSINTPTIAQTSGQVIEALGDNPITDFISTRSENAPIAPIFRQYLDPAMGITLRDLV
jgi:hypothetical protein